MYLQKLTSFSHVVLRQTGAEQGGGGVGGPLIINVKNDKNILVCHFSPGTLMEPDHRNA